MAASVLMTARPSELKSMLKVAFKAKRPAMIWGPPGVGKSDIIEQLGKELGKHVIDMRLILMEPTDLKGIPYYDPVTGTMKWSVAEELPNVSDSHLGNCILFLDELNSAPQSVQGAAYQLILNRKIGQYHLPEDTVIVAAGNRMTDRGVTYKMPSPLANRFVHFEIEANAEDWMKWAFNNEVDSSVVSFIKCNEGSLFDFDPKKHDRAFATPRSWAFVSEMVGECTEDNLLNKIVCGTVGEGLATTFMTFRKIGHKIPDAVTVLEGKAPDLEKDLDRSAHYLLATNLVYKMVQTDRAKDGQKKMDDYMTQLIKYSSKNFSVELIAYLFRAFMSQGVKYSPIRAKNEAFKEFAKKYGEYWK